MLKTGQSWAGLFVCRDSTGALATPSVGPAGVLYVDGAANGASVTISLTNPYKFVVTLPTLTAGKNCSMYITATIAGIATASIVAIDQADTILMSDNYSRIGAPISTSISADIANLPQSGSIATVADIWGETLPGSYGAGTAGGKLGETDADIDELITTIGAAGAGLTALPAAILDLTDGIETGLTPRNALRLIAAALSGKLSGAATTSVKIKNAIADNKTRITATVDADGNRTAITTDLT